MRRSVRWLLAWLLTAALVPGLATAQHGAQAPAPDPAPSLAQTLVPAPGPATSSAPSPATSPPPSPATAPAPSPATSSAPSPATSPPQDSAARQPVAPPSLAAELSVRRVEVTTAFSGAEILVFGATERVIGPQGDEVVVVATGPQTSMMVRQKVNAFGFWVNGAAARFNRVPSYFALASTRPLTLMLDRVERGELRLSLDQLPLVQLGASGPAFREALARLQQQAGLWVVRERPIEVSGGRLFHARLPLPATVLRGAYQVEVLLVRDRRVVARQDLRLDVVGTGTAAWIATIARGEPVLYALACIVLAAMAGWMGSLVFGRR